jgi:hypothetical protein
MDRPPLGGSAAAQSAIQRREGRLVQIRRG